MNDIVLVPVYYRPDYLYLCLSRLAEAEGARQKVVWICQDQHTGFQQNAHELTLVRNVPRMFIGKFADIRYTERKVNSYSGNTYNLMEMYKEAHATDAQFVFLVEDDVLVTKDFFRWHEAVHARDQYFASVGWKCIRNPKAIAQGGPEDYIESTRDYASIGVCWPRQNLQFLVSHAVEPYYRSQIEYMRTHFGNNRIPPNQWTEQDGVVMRTLLQEKNKHVVAWPVLPRCQHIGIHGYHRPGGYKFTGGLQDRVAKLSAMAANVEEMKRISKDPFKDCLAQPVIEPWSVLRCVQRLEYDGAI